MSPTIDPKDIAELQSDIEGRDPHGDDIFTYAMPAYAAHLDICGGMVTISVSERTAREMLTGLTAHFADEQIDPDWATSLDKGKGAKAN